MKINMLECVSEIGKEIEICSSSCLIYRKKRQRFDVENQEQIFYLKTGRISIYRKSDNVLTSSLSGPAILGLSQMKSEDKTHYFRCDTDCEMWGLPVDDASFLFDDKGLWRYAFELLTHLVKEYYLREHMIAQKNVRGIIIQHIKYIWEMSDDMRAQTSIYSFILQRNHISRSSIHKTVCTLENSGLIKVSRGKLVDCLIE